MKYKVGDRVEILGRFRTSDDEDRWKHYMPDNIIFMDQDEDLPEPSKRVWVAVTVYAVYSDETVIFWKNEDYTWIIQEDDVARFLRPLDKVQSQIATATSCVECHESFMYPVEYNCDQGRVCFGCKSTYAWKYPSLKES